MTKYRKPRNTLLGALTYTVLSFLLGVFILCVVLLMIPNADAQEVEVGIGISQYKDRGDGYWVQEGFQNKLSLKAPSLELGVTGNILSYEIVGVDWAIDWNYLGVVHTQALATPSDPNYNPITKKCNGNCWKLSNFVGSGHDQGVSFVARPYVIYESWRVGFEIGPYIHKNTWSEAVYDWHGTEFGPMSTVNVKSNEKLQLDYVIGFNVSKGNYTLKYQYFKNQSYKDDPYGAIWSGSHVILMTYKF